jgi:ribosomal protein S18 acetylase RimI-like enzyme
MRGRAADHRSWIAPGVTCDVRIGEDEADRTYVRDLGERTVMTSVAAFRNADPPMVFAAFDRLLEIVEGQSHLLFIAWCGGQRAGFLIMLDELPDEVTSMPQGFIAYMAVEPTRRHEGVGAALLEAAENEARRLGLPYITLMVTEENAAARALYERNGYFTERRLLCKVL